MKIILFGANGQLGNALKKILQAGETVLGKIPECYRDCDVLSLDLPEYDISDYPHTKAVVYKYHPDLIVNCAAFTNVNLCESQQDTAFRANTLGPRNLAMIASELGIKLLHVSTDYVFSGDGQQPYAEWDACAPESIYGKSKLLGEQYIRQFCPRSFIVRTAWMYGAVGGNFVKTMLRLAREEKPITVVDDQWGNPTNAVDLAHHILKVAATDEYGIYHCTGNGICSWYKFACKILEYARIPASITPCTTAEYPTPAKRPAYSALDHRMLRCTVGDQMRPWEDALQDFINQFQEEA